MQLFQIKTDIFLNSALLNKQIGFSQNTYFEKNSLVFKLF
jgi:hypothetical protein